MFEKTELNRKILRFYCDENIVRIFYRLEYENDIWYLTLKENIYNLQVSIN